MAKKEQWEDEFDKIYKFDFINEGNEKEYKEIKQLIKTQLEQKDKEFLDMLDEIDSYKKVYIDEKISKNGTVKKQTIFVEWNSIYNKIKEFKKRLIN